MEHIKFFNEGWFNKSKDPKKPPIDVNDNVDIDYSKKWVEPKLVEEDETEAENIIEYLKDNFKSIPFTQGGRIVWNELDNNELDNKDIGLKKFSDWTKNPKKLNKIENNIDLIYKEIIKNKGKHYDDFKFKINGKSPKEIEIIINPEASSTIKTNRGPGSFSGMDNMDMSRIQIFVNSRKLQLHTYTKHELAGMIFDLNKLIKSIQFNDKNRSKKEKASFGISPEITIYNLYRWLLDYKHGDPSSRHNRFPTLEIKKQGDDFTFNWNNYKHKDRMVSITMNDASFEFVEKRSSETPTGIKDKRISEISIKIDNETINTDNLNKQRIGNLVNYLYKRYKIIYYRGNEDSQESETDKYAERNRRKKEAREEKPEQKNDSHPRLYMGNGPINM